MKRLLQKIRAHWVSIPRKTRVLINLCAIITFAFGLYIFSGSPTLSAEQRYRRAELTQLVGPADILGIEPLTDSDFNQVILADDGDHVILYAFDEDNSAWDNFVYRRKTGPVTVLAAPHDPWNDSPEEISVIAFDSHPEAVRAALDIELRTDYSMRSFSRQFSLESERQAPGYFVFKLNHSPSVVFGHTTILSYAMYQFTLLCGNGLYATHGALDVPVTVRLYDNADSLIYEQSMIIRDIAREARESQHQ